ncbi:hypothetical protein LGK95_20750 [Clostridium algoriphilum]|uniref:hypothetical protein n=1 Tax=Clostridium algoriphilum TaxID=198347 RepID=UPI001CF4A0DE|nr:hypothetical protein [Clostridium algoriphilum]MCB2295894.1 hypothetical protein [Clostridium algoriphilum]
MRKKISLINPTTICMLICAILLFDVSYRTFEYSVGDPIGAANGRLLVAIAGGIGGAVMGFILASIAHLFFKPSRTNRLLQEQNRMLNNNNNNINNKIDKLNKLNELKKSGAISENELKKLKNEILNER